MLYLLEGLRGESYMMKRICVLAGVLAVAPLACDERPKGNGGNKGGVVVLEQAQRIVVEVESAKNAIAPFEVEENDECAGGKCLVLPEVWATKQELNPTFKVRGGTELVSMKRAKDNPLGKALVPNGTVELPLEIAKAGRYNVWVRAWFANTCANSFYLSVDTPPPVDTDGDGKYDENPPHTLSGSTCERWRWVTLRDRELDLAEGGHVVRIFNREDGIKIDQILFAEISDGPLPPYSPQGMEKSHP
jgi:hypothetical protein